MAPCKQLRVQYSKPSSRPMKPGPVLPRLKGIRGNHGFATSRKPDPPEVKHKRRQTQAIQLPSTARLDAKPGLQKRCGVHRQDRNQLGQIQRHPVPSAKVDSMTAAVVLQRYSADLTAFEESEILAYSEIYFVGKTSKKTRGIPQASKNNGYDDERGDYRIVLHDHIAYRYEVLDILGNGSFGQVAKVFDHKTGTYQALKIIRNKKRFHHQALVEVRILEFCTTNEAGHDYGIVHMYESTTFRNHLCITFELLSMNLYEFIKSSNFRGLSLNFIRRIASQLLNSLKFLKQNGIIHSDLKPENILLKSPNKSLISLIDFGSSCFETERIYTYIQSRFYRSPEVILGNPYNTEIDMWSLGCILVELYTGFPLFQGENENEQLACIMEVMGVPPLSIYQSSPRRKVFFDSNMTPRITRSAQGRIYQPGMRDLATTMRCSDRRFVDFIVRCLEWDPINRMTPMDALRHPFIIQGRSGRASTGKVRSSQGESILPLIGGGAGLARP
uniref:dual-specificity kinase n=1 Tax=Spongospora subterranea TaxID=70186 RepID=A0A0H5RCT4_9EUKA|eukprot:CRZ11407.1 hypothetical protein [Spongospora subterranea]